jgi:hypothetical protein
MLKIKEKQQNQLYCKITTFRSCKMLWSIHFQCDLIIIIKLHIFVLPQSERSEPFIYISGCWDSGFLNRSAVVVVVIVVAEVYM